jgi:DNA-directed RNA polymerase specialized sigma24 family protein
MPRPNPALASVTARTILSASTYHAVRLFRLGLIAAQDVKDVRQDLALAIIERRAQYDPTRGSPRTFADRVARNAGWNLVETARAAKRSAPVSSVSIDLCETEPALRSDTTEQRDLILDVESALHLLQPEQRALCLRLVDEPLVAVARAMRRGRAAVRHQVADLKKTLLGMGLDVWLEAA